MQYFLSHIDLMAFKEMKKIDSKIINIYHPVILCGDFNCDFRSNKLIFKITLILQEKN